MRRDPITVRFEREEAEIVAQALHQFQTDEPAHRLRAVKMRDLIDGELGKVKR